MKKTLLLAAVGMLLSASIADAKVVYYENADGVNWEKVYSYCWSPEDEKPFAELTAETIDGHTVYKRDAGNKSNVIFLNRSTWNEDGKEQTSNIINFVDGGVYKKDGTQIANITDGAYVAIDDPTPPVEDPNIYLRGTMNNWDPESAWAFTKVSDTEYTITTSITKGTAFKIADANWDKVNYGGGQSVLPNGTYSLVFNSNDDLVAGEDLNQVTFTFNPTTAVLTTSDGSEEPLVVKWWCAWDLGDGNGWQFGNEFEKQTEGTYKVSIETPEGSEANYFAVFQGINNTDWKDEGTTRYTPLNQTTIEVNEDGEYDMQVGDDGAWQITKNGTWTVVIDPRVQAKTTISFDWGDSTGEANVLIDRASDEDHSFESFALTEDPTGVFTFSNETLMKGDQLKFNIHGKDYYYDPSAGTIEGDDFVNANTDNLIVKYPLIQGDGLVTFDYQSGVTMEININQDVNTVTVTLADAPRVSMTITKNGESEIHRIKRQGETTIYIMEHAVELQPTDQIDFRVLGKRYTVDFGAPQAVAEADETAKTYTMTVNTDENPAPECKLTGSYLFKVDNSGDAPVLTVTPSTETGVSSIAADNAKAVYFNLQGVQIEKPENGIFIEVRGNKASKVSVK